MNVRAKMKCVAIEPEPDGEGGTLTFKPSSKTENDAFHTYSLSSQLHLFTENQASLDQCEVGKEYYLDVSPVEEAVGQTPRTLPNDLGNPEHRSLEFAMSEQEVVALMESSKSEAEWNQNSDHVLKQFGGYPAFWHEAIVVSGLLRRVKSSFET